MHSSNPTSSALSTAIAAAQETRDLTGAGQTVVVIDSGIAYDHFALGGGLGSSHRVVGGYDFAERDADPYDDGPLGFHGTHIAGIIGSSDPAHPGVAPEVDLVALRVFDDHGRSDFAWIEEALWWVHEHRNDFEHPITTINLSLGGDWNGDDVPEWGQLEPAFAALKADGIVIVASAGNNFEEGPTSVGLTYPAASPNVIPVASVDGQGNLSDFSQRHPRVIAAYGEDITSTIPDYLFGFDGVTDDYYAISGTSVAAPLVVGAAVLIREALTDAAPNRAVNQDLVLQILTDTSDLVYDPVTQQSYHRMNLARALESIAVPTPAATHQGQDPPRSQRIPRSAPIPTSVYGHLTDAALAQSSSRRFVPPLPDTFETPEEVRRRQRAIDAYMRRQP
jgi:subtilisin family serine protease